MPIHYSILITPEREYNAAKKSHINSVLIILSLFQLIKQNT